MNSLWEVRAASATHYLMGSVHLLPEDAYPLTGPFERAYNSAEVVMVESDLGSLSEEERRRLILAKAHYGRRKSLRVSVADETYELVKRRAAELGMDLSALNRLKPIFVMSEFTVRAAATVGLSGGYGLDNYFLARAKADGNEVLCLETAEEALSFLADLPPEVQEQSLLDAVKSLDEVAVRLKRTARAWAAGDEKALVALMAELEGRCPEISETLIYGRNENWLPRIDECLGSERSHLVVVGVTHLVGARGIIRALQERGYFLEQL